MKNSGNKIIPKFHERTLCPSCNSKELEIKFKHTINEKSLDYLKNIYNYNGSRKNLDIFNKSKIVICQCKNCHSKFHKLIPCDLTLKYIYTTLIKKDISLKKNKFHEPFIYKKSINLLKRLKSLLKINRDTKIYHLDFGCGWGTILKASRDLNLNPIGIEPTKYQRKNMERENIKVYSSIQTLIKKGIPKNFKIITSNQVLEHVKNPNLILSELRKISSEGSILYLSVPAFIDKEVLSFEDVFNTGALQPFEHLNCFSKRSIEILSKTNNFLLLTPTNISKNLILLYRKYNIFIILLLVIHTLIRRGVFYLIPKE